MTGWLMFAAIGAVALGCVLLIGRADRGLVMLVLSALCVAAAGYAWQGSPGLAGAPAAGRARQGLKPDTVFATERIKLLDPYGEAGEWLVLADGLNRSGEDQAAAQILAGQVAKHPREVALRIGYAHALLVLADYHVVPAVALAYDRAVAIAGADPAARYFAALGQLEAGDLVAAEQGWRALDAALPAASPWHQVLGPRLAMFDWIHGRGPKPK